jgi:hypothetical protein
MEKLHGCEISVSQSGLNKRSSLLGNDAVWTGKKSPKFRSTALPTSSGPIDRLGLLEPEDGSKMLIRKVCNYLPIGKS